MDAHRLRRAALVLAFLLLGTRPVLALDLTTIATDPFTQASCATSSATSHKALAEPHGAAFGNTIVTAFQTGRASNGGACTIGFSTSADNGLTWKSGLLPGITKYAGGGAYDRATDPVVAYDARRKTWLVASLALKEIPGDTIGKALLVSRSRDGGLTWSKPVTANATSLDPDKEWITCDNTPTSPYYGNCYLVWDDHGAGNKLLMSTSRDGGLTWGAAKGNRAYGIGGQPVVRPSGTVIVPTANANMTSIGAFHSSDGGASWSGVTRITAIQHHAVGGGLREAPFPTAGIDKAGTVYVMWSDCRFRSSCRSNDIVFVKSRNSLGTYWTSVKRVPIDATTSGIDHFIPGLAVNGADTTNVRLGLTYYYYKPNSTVLNIGFVSSRNGGTSWSLPTAVTTAATAFPPGWLAPTGQGRMAGDYIATTFAGDQKAHGIVVVAASPTTGAATACTTTARDNCRVSAASFTAAATGAALVAADEPVLSGSTEIAPSADAFGILPAGQLTSRR